VRAAKVFWLLLSLFLLIRKKERLLWIRPMDPARLRQSIIELGPSFIKLAQVLATRADFFDPPYLEALRTLHDELPPMERREFERVWQRHLAHIPFERFDPKPIASASIAQVHVAQLEGKKVAVKVRRAGIARQVRRDMRILHFYLQLFSPLFSHHTKNSLEAVLSELGEMLQKEVDFRLELRNLKRFRKTYPQFARYPEPYEEYCDEAVIVMSYMEGVRFDDKEGLARLGIDFRPLIQKVVEFYAEQMLVRGLFHADPHPGNLLVSSEGELILLDFGMVKQIPNEMRIAIIELVKSAHERDFELFVSAAKRLGVITYEAPPAAVAEFVEAMFAIFEDEHLSSVDMQRLAFEVLASMRDLPFKLPQDAVYILRVSAIVEGLGTTYIENFNGVKDILPILQKNIPRALGYKESLIEMIFDELREAPYVARDFKDTLRLAAQGALKTQIAPDQLEFLEGRLLGWWRRAALGVVLLFGSLLAAILGQRELALLLFGLGALRLLLQKL